jgi:hypothetical protein
VCQATGWSWDYAESHLTVTRMRALNRHWAHSPPSHVLLRLIAYALGVRPADAGEATSSTAPAEPWRELFELAGDPRSGIAMRGKPPL